MLHLLSQYRFSGTYGGYLKVNSLSESENSALKRDPMGPRPNMAIDRAQIATEHHERRRLSGLANTAMHSMSQTALEDCEVSQALSSDLVRYGLDDLFSEFTESLNYKRFKISNQKYYVRRWHWSKLDTNPNGEEYWRCLVPRFDRTRIVTVHTSTWVAVSQMSKCRYDQLSKCPPHIFDLCFNIYSRWKFPLKMFMPEI
jgi:hypothetical protein